MVSEAFQNEVGHRVHVHRLLSLLRLSPERHSTEDVLLQLAVDVIALGPATPSSSWRLPCFRCPGFPSWRSPSCGSIASSFVAWRSPLWHLRRGLLPVALAALSLFRFSSSSPLVDDTRQCDRIRLSPRRGSSCSSSLLVVIPRVRLLSPS